jgi:hypothetical protein
VNPKRRTSPERGEATEGTSHPSESARHVSIEAKSRGSEGQGYTKKRGWNRGENEQCVEGLDLKTE